MPDTGEIRWMTYAEIRDAFGLPSTQAALQRSRRAGWPRRLNNSDKFARVAVPVAALAAPRTPIHEAFRTLPAMVLVRGHGGTREGPGSGTDPHAIDALLAELKAGHDRLAFEARDRAERAEGEAAALRDAVAHERGLVNAEREKTARAEGERDALQEALRAAKAAAEDAGRRASIAEERAAAAHHRGVEVAAVLSRVAEGLEHVRQTQATATEAAAAARADREAAQAKAEEAALRAGEAEARAAEATRRAAVAEARLEHLQRLPAEAAAPDPAELEAAQARAVEAEGQAAEARRRAEEAERRATAANERFDRFQRKRIAEAQEAAARAAEAAEVASLEAEARRPLWRRIFRRRAGRAL